MPLIVLFVIVTVGEIPAEEIPPPASAVFAATSEPFRTRVPILRMPPPNAPAWLSTTLDSTSASEPEFISPPPSWPPAVETLFLTTQRVSVREPELNNAPPSPKTSPCCSVRPEMLTVWPTAMSKTRPFRFPSTIVTAAPAPAIVID